MQGPTWSAPASGGSPSAAPVDAPDSAERWIVSEQVWVGPGALPRHLGIGVRGARIVALRDGGAPAGLPAAAVLDFGRRPICPTFVNAHVHLAMAPLRGVTDLAGRLGNVVSDVFFGMESHLKAADVRAFTRLGAYEALLAGVGEVWDHYYHGLEVATALAEVGLTGVVAPTLQDRAGPGAHAHERALDDTRRLADEPRWAAAGIGAALGPHATDTVSDTLLERAAELARARGLPLHLHVAQAATELSRASGSGAVVRRLLERTEGLRLLVAHGLFLARDDVERLVEADATLVVCPGSQVQFGFLGPFGPWCERGGGWAVGTDTVASNDAGSIQRELPWLAAWGSLEASFSTERAALLVDGSAARIRALEARRVEAVARATPSTERLLEGAFGFHLPIGPGGGPRGLVVGARANFQVLDPDAPELFPADDLPRRLAYGDTSGAIHALFVAGRSVGTPGDFRRSVLSSPAYRDTLEEACRRRDELLQRWGGVEPGALAAQRRASSSDST